MITASRKCFISCPAACIDEEMTLLAMPAISMIEFLGLKDWAYNLQGKYWNLIAHERG